MHVSVVIGLCVLQDLDLRFPRAVPALLAAHATMLSNFNWLSKASERASALLDSQAQSDAVLLRLGSEVGSLRNVYA